MSNPANDHDLLLKLVQKVDMIYEEFRRVSNGTGFPRCAERRGEIEASKQTAASAHKRIDTLNNRLWWAITTSIVTGLGFITSIILTVVKGAMNT